jgi:hypothetical protein
MQLMTGRPSSDIVKEIGERDNATRSPRRSRGPRAKALGVGGHANAEEVIRRALETLEAEENWTENERAALDQKIDHSIEQAEIGRLYGPDEALRKLAALKQTHPAKKL